SKYGIMRFDRIVGANGKLFELAHPDKREFGEYGPIMDLALAIEKSQSNGRLQLMIARGSLPVRNINIQIEKLPNFSSNYPVRCQRTELMAQEIMQLLINDSESTRMSNGNSFALVGLSMLAYGDAKMRKAVENYMLKVLSGEERNNLKKRLRLSTQSEGNSWHNGFKLIFLAEYFFATGDMDVFPTLQKLAYAVDEEHQNAFGASGHGRGGIGSYYSLGFGPPCGLNALGLALAEKAGAKANKRAYDNYYNYATRSTDIWVHQKKYDYKFEVKEDKEYYNCYAHITYETDEVSSWALQNLNTSIAAMAFYHMPTKNPNAKKLSEKFVNNIIFNYMNNAYIHATPMIGNFFATLALNSLAINDRPLTEKIYKNFNNPYSIKYTGNIVGKVAPGKEPQTEPIKKLTSKDAWRKILDYRKYLLIHSRLSSDTYFYFYPRLSNSGFWGGDGYLNLQACTLYNLMAILSSNKRQLLVHGGTKRNWFADSKIAPVKQTLADINEYHRTHSEELLKKAELIYQLKNADGTSLPKRPSSAELVEIKLDAYEIAAKVADNYRPLPSARTASIMIRRIESELGGKVKCEQLLKNRDGMRKVNYAIANHERFDHKEFISLRTKILEYVVDNYPKLPCAKVAADELKKMPTASSSSK
ncbi:MAG: DUF6288 domain-containing protein, partial [Lentisphaeria bacterium]